MRVTGINDTYTKGANEVAFDFNESPDNDLVSSITLADGISAKVVGGSVVLKTAQKLLPLKSSHVDAFLDAYHKAASARSQAQQNAEMERRSMLLKISHSLGYRLSSQADDES